MDISITYESGGVLWVLVSMGYLFDHFVLDGARTFDLHVCSKWNAGTVAVPNMHY